jgi:acetyl esterase/lipase
MDATGWGIFAVLTAMGCATLGANFAAAADVPVIVRDVEYARVGNERLALDLHMPAGEPRAPLIVWVHGGAWRSGSRESMPLVALVEQGYAVASVDYRLTPVAPFPAQVHDIKAAIRVLRAEQGELGIDARRIAIAGDSAGGHLAALVGVSAGDTKLGEDAGELEGQVGDHDGESSDVQAIIDFYGPTNLTTILDQSTPHGLGVRIPALQLLLGGQPEDKPEIAKLASVVTHVDANDPPLLIIHGDQDPQVPINQSHELVGRYEEFKLPVQFEVVHGGAHGGDVYHDAKRIEIARAFLERSMKSSRDP